MPAANTRRAAGSAEAESVVEVAVTEQVSVPEAAPAPVTLMAGGAVQISPGGRFAVAGTITVTEPVKPPLGVTVTVVGTDAPVVELKGSGVGL